jgi:hypothetical protein
MGATRSGLGRKSLDPGWMLMSSSEYDAQFEGLHREATT